MRIVITGGAGFIGSNLVHYWPRTHADDDVVVVDALTYAGRRESLIDPEKNPRFSFVRADIGDARAMEAALVGPDMVINLAAESHNDRVIKHPIPFVTTNVLGTAVLLEACRKAGVPRFRHVSTNEVFGSLALEEPRRFTEESPYRPRGPYSAS
jgi:dTDP-glucose 4,6-dehydratase